MSDKYSVTTTKIPATIGSQSCVGVTSTPPVGRGNYFRFGNDGTYCVNFWAENLRAAIPLFLQDGMIEVTIIKQLDNGRVWGIVVDERIPKEWFNLNLCFSGHGAPKDPDIINLIFDTAKDHSCGRNQYLNPAEHYPLHGYEYKENGAVSWKPGSLVKCPNCNVRP